MPCHGHYQRVCSRCSTMISQCRCAAKDKKTYYEVCNACHQDQETRGEGDQPPTMKKRYRKRHADFESFDRIELEVVPRYKTSGLSGDEWRTSVRARFRFKGELMHEEWAQDMRSMIMMLGYKWMLAQEPIPERIIDIEKKKCDQPGCSADAVVTFDLKEEFSDQGEKLDAEDCTLKSYRKFCSEHSTRGDCGREDRDANYVKRRNR